MKEKELFLKRFYQLKDRWENYCWITWKYIDENDLTPSSFPHLLSKKMFPQFKYSLNNIWLVVWIEEHKKIDSIMNIIRKEIWYEELNNLLSNHKEIYNLIKKYNV